ncbi:MAG: alpha/beta hydrolase [Leptospiraceae bacterium]|nr:alpha/beta hydrolase [Leptospiraceae bacterium]
MKKTFISLSLLILFSDCFITRRLIFVPKGKPLHPNYSGKLVKVPSSNRTAIGYFTQNGSKLLVLFHGQFGSIYNFSYLGSQLVQNGYSVLLVEYPGYGLAKEFSASESNIYEDSQVLIQHVQTTYHFKPSNTISLGYSLGTGVAVEMTNRKLSEKTILFAPYSSIPAVASIRYVPLLPHLLIIDRFDTYSKSSEIKSKVLIFHGNKDEIIPFSMGKELSKRFSNVEFIEIKGGSHNLFSTFNSSHWLKLNNFITR